jgi:hypothetical protein
MCLNLFNLREKIILTQIWQIKQIKIRLNPCHPCANSHADLARQIKKIRVPNHHNTKYSK